MSFKYDGSLLPGAFHYGTTAGLGTLGSDIPITGEAGGSYLSNDVLINDLGANEVRGLITRFPVNGSLVADEFGTFVYVGTTDYFLYQLIVDGVPADEDIGYGPGIGRVDLVSGSSGLLSGSMALDSVQALGGAVSLDALTLVLKLLRNRQTLDASTGKFTLYDDDGSTILLQANAWEDTAGTIPYRGNGLRKLDRLI